VKENRLNRRTHAG